MPQLSRTLNENSLAALCLIVCFQRERKKEMGGMEFEGWGGEEDLGGDGAGRTLVIIQWIKIISNIKHLKV